MDLEGLERLRRELDAYELRIAAPVEVVWDHLTTAEVAADHQRGWAYFLGILRDTVSAG